MLGWFVTAWVARLPDRDGWTRRPVGRGVRQHCNPTGDLWHSTLGQTLQIDGFPSRDGAYGRTSRKSFAPTFSGATECATTQVSVTTIAADASGADGPLERDTVDGYRDSLERLMIVANAPAWSPALRFVDPCLAGAALNAALAKLSSDLILETKDGRFAGQADTSRCGEPCFFAGVSSRARRRRWGLLFWKLRTSVYL